MKTTQEMTLAFELALDNIMSGSAPGFSEYEKSVLLNRAGKELLKNRLVPGGNRYLVGVDGSPKRLSEFASFYATSEITSSGTANFHPNGIPFALPEYLAPINFMLVTSTGVMRQCVPLNPSEYQRLMQKPYHYPFKRQAWLIDTGKKAAEVIVSPVDSEEEWKLRVRYIRLPDPIILADFPEGVTIDGKRAASLGDYPESMHDDIIQRACEIAKATYSSDQSGQAQMQNQIAIGQRSE